MCATPPAVFFAISFETLQMFWLLNVAEDLHVILI